MEWKELNGYEDLKYGNINREDLSYLREENVFTKLKDQFTDFPYPDIYTAEKEIEKLMVIQNKAMDNPMWKKYKKFMLACDGDIQSVFKEKCEKLGIEYKEKYLYNIQEKLGGLVMELKQYYSRPRPYQVAYYTNQIDFHNFPTITGNTPAYPSGHSCQSWFMCLVIAFHNPHVEKEIMKFGKRIAKTREVLGVHYPSDTIFGREIAESLLENKEIRDIYFNKKRKKKERKIEITEPIIDPMRDLRNK